MTGRLTQSVAYRGTKWSTDIISALSARTRCAGQEGNEDLSSATYSILG